MICPVCRGEMRWYGDALICPVCGEEVKHEHESARVPVTERPLRIQGNKVHLCDSCAYIYPDCPSKKENVIFGDGVGNDNICCCSCYDPVWDREGCEE